MSSQRRPERVAMLMIHTSPLEQPGLGDAGGMNVYVVETAKRMALSGTEVDIFTRATASKLAPKVELTGGVNVIHLSGGPFEGLRKEELPGQLCVLAAALARVEAHHERGYYDLVHSHYWLSGQLGMIAAQSWGVPLVHTMHTMAKVKNQSLAEGDEPEPSARAIGEEQVVAAADALIANTEAEAANLVGLYGACPDRVHVVPPGVDLEKFSPAGVGGKQAARKHLGIRQDALLLSFVGRVQPHKGPEVLIRAAAEMLQHDPSLRSRLVVAIVGGASGSNLEPQRLRELSNWLGLKEVIRFEEPAKGDTLAEWYRSSDIVCVPSYSESFGLVALEAQACGTPVVASAVGGLRTAVADGSSGLLVDGHDPKSWSSVLLRLAHEPERRAQLAVGAIKHAQRFDWQRTSSAILDVYQEILNPAQINDRALA
jgi:D-inositol-3-phosphate glycosyltransferase